MLIYGINPVLEALRAGRVRRCASPSAPSGRVDGWSCAGAARQGVAVRRVSAADARSRGARRRAPGRGRRPGCDRRRSTSPISSRRAKRSGADRRARRHRGSAQRRRDPADRRRGRRDGVVRQSRHAAPLGGAAAKASAGAVSHVQDGRGRQHRAGARGARRRPASGRSGWPAIAEALRRDRFDAATPLVVGRRRDGLRRLVRERCDWLVSIPMRGHVAEPERVGGGRIALFEARPAASKTHAEARDSWTLRTADARSRQQIQELEPVSPRSDLTASNIAPLAQDVLKSTLLSGWRSSVGRAADL